MGAHHRHTFHGHSKPLAGRSAHPQMNRALREVPTARFLAYLPSAFFFSGGVTWSQQQSHEQPKKDSSFRIRRCDSNRSTYIAAAPGGYEKGTILPSCCSVWRILGGPVASCLLLFARHLRPRFLFLFLFCNGFYFFLKKKKKKKKKK